MKYEAYETTTGRLAYVLGPTGRANWLGWPELRVHVLAQHAGESDWVQDTPGSVVGGWRRRPDLDRETPPRVQLAVRPDDDGGLRVRPEAQG